jgi:hypothetical protein
MFLAIDLNQKESNCSSYPFARLPRQLLMRILTLLLFASAGHAHVTGGDQVHGCCSPLSRGHPFTPRRPLPLPPPFSTTLSPPRPTKPCRPPRVTERIHNGHFQCSGTLKDPLHCSSLQSLTPPPSPPLRIGMFSLPRLLPASTIIVHACI